MDINGKNIVVLGAGKSGILAAVLAKKKGAGKVVLSDVKPKAKMEQDVLNLETAGIEIEAGGHGNETVLNADIIVVSPGVSLFGEWFEMAKRHNKEVLGEIEFAYRFMEKGAKIIGITGTNGKTTVTTLTDEIFKAQLGDKAVLAGNIGIPFCDVVCSKKGYTHVIMEISSFQLDTIKEFKTDAAVILNITDDHMDRYDSMQAYAESKARIFLNHTPQDILVLNRHDRFTEIMASMSKSRKVYFSAYAESDDCYFFGDEAYFRKINGKKEKLFDAAGVQLLGKHNVENILACLALSEACGLDMHKAEETIKNFKGLPHRIEFVAEAGGKKFYDDSKGTNVDAVIRALETFDRPLALILGGREKNTDFEQLKKVLPGNVKAVIALGENRDKLEVIFKDSVPVVKCASMEEAVNAGCALDVEVVLLSPACASFDLFKSYGHRGDEFKKYVLKAAENGKV
ncbi:MAG: UDP-N-acetylmuramoyl-L-alanine--D-glutamate ligase [Candidatus Goldbacteria bacterium]|nr:UDP-N-acetylmuramoyl-L-alanine--D-glutamate ligase [Candidatus Goldiibacteriota bacterium]